MECIKIRRATIEPAGAELLADIIVGTAVTSVDITGLDIGKDDELLLVSDFNFSQDNAVLIMINNNLTSTNYYCQRLVATSTTVTAERGNYPRITSSLETGTKNETITKIKLTNSGYFIYQAVDVRAIGSSSIQLQQIYGTSTFISASITSLTLRHNLANGIGIGSRFQLYKTGGA